MDVNKATREQLLRVPGVGPLSAQRILDNRSRHAIDTWRDLQAMGVVGKRAKTFISFNGYKPEKTKQLKMELLDQREERWAKTPKSTSGAAGIPSSAHAGGCSSCTTGACGGCPINFAKSKIAAVEVA